MDICKRLKNYFNFGYDLFHGKRRKSKDSFIISRALIKYEYYNFSVAILEYCDKYDLLVREQYYFDKLNPQYNILKIAESSRDFKHSEETKISKSLKEICVKENLLYLVVIIKKKLKNYLVKKK